MKQIVTAIVAAVAMIVSAAANAAEFQLKLGHDQTSGHPYDLGVKRFADGVKKATGGAVEISIFPAAQLGDSAEQIEGLRLGTQDLALSAFSHASQFCTELGLFGAPFLFESDAHFAKVFDGEVGDIVDEACRKRYGISLLSTFTSGYRLMFNGRRPVENAADLEGLKIRVMGGEADALTWKVFGAIPAPMPYSEVYSALQAGVIDGAENEPASVLANKFYEAAPYFAITNHLVLPMGLFVSERVLQRLPEKYRGILRQEAEKAAVWERGYITRRNGEALEEMKKKYGVKVSGLDASELRKQGANIQDQVADKLDMHDLLEKIRAAAN